MGKLCVSKHACKESFGFSKKKIDLETLKSKSNGSSFQLTFRIKQVFGSGDPVVFK